MQFCGAALCARPPCACGAGIRLSAGSAAKGSARARAPLSFRKNPGFSRFFYCILLFVLI